MPSKTTFYITTAISYPNGPPHIGHAYEAIATDAIARFMRLDGYDVYFLTGTDEHGQKMQQTAAREGLTARQLRDRNVPRFEAMVKRLNCSNDDFIHTTEERHHRASHRHLAKHGSGTATSISTNMPAGTRCATRPITPRTRRTSTSRSNGSRPRPARRSNGSRRRAISSSSPPTSRSCSTSTSACRISCCRKERLNEVASFVRGGLQDLSISRTTFDWGVRGARQDRRQAHHVCLGRRADELHYRRRLSRTSAARNSSAIGRHRCTSSARTSCVSTRSIGRHF